MSCLNKIYRILKLNLYFIFLFTEIIKIYDDEKKKLDLDDYTKRLVIAKKRLNTIQATIISVQVIYVRK